MPPRQSNHAIKVRHKNELILEATRIQRLCHEQIVQFVGICTLPESEPVWLILEYVSKGDLKTYLQSRPKTLPLSDMKLISILDQVPLYNIDIRMQLRERGFREFLNS